MNQPSPRPRLNPRLVFAAVAVVFAILLWLWLGRAPVDAAPQAKVTAIPVGMAPVGHADVPVYLEGLGTVQAFNTVTITARLDGQLQHVDFVEGQMVKQGDLLAQIDPRPLQAALEQAEATKAKDAAQLSSAKRDLERYMVLAPQNLTSQQTVDTQRAAVDSTTAQLQVDQAQIDNARTQLDYARIVSPISGRTGIRHVDAGNNVHATDTTGIVVVTQMQPIAVIFTLPEDALGSVNQALGAGSVQVTALSRDNQTPLDTGSVSLVDNQIDSATGTMRIKATFPNQHNALWPGQFVNVRLLLEQQQGALTVPTTAIERGPSGLFVYVVKADSSVEARPIMTGAESGALTVVTQGLQAGERVVISNQYRLQPGAAVREQSARQEIKSVAPAASKSGTG